MAIAVILSANHYLVDGLLGALVALTGLLVAERLQRRELREGTGGPDREVLERDPTRAPAGRAGPNADDSWPPGPGTPRALSAGSTAVLGEQQREALLAERGARTAGPPWSGSDLPVGHRGAADGS
jgi:hypothetical protein